MLPLAMFGTGAACRFPWAWACVRLIGGGGGGEDTATTAGCPCFTIEVPLRLPSGGGIGPDDMASELYELVLTALTLIELGSMAW